MRAIPQPDNEKRLLLQATNLSKRFRLQRDRQRSLQETFIHLLHRRRSDAEYFWPLRDLSLTVRTGDAIGILGQNGSGKSTLLKLLTGVLQPTTGEIHTNARIASLLELGAGFHPDLTGRENIFLNASIYGLSSRFIRRYLDSIIEFAEIGEFIDTPVKHYSSGMYVRLGFAVAVHTQPELLIVDEVLTVGDQVFQQKCMHRIEEMLDEGVALILVSHNVEDIRRLCQRAVWLQNGRMRAEGRALDVVDEYLAYTNELFYAQQRAEIEESPANMITAPNAQRWGTYQVEIVGVELCNTKGQGTEQFFPGEMMRIRIHYMAKERIVRPTFGLAIYRRDGMHVNGPNSVDEGYQLEEIEGKGIMEYCIEQLPLNPGRYELTVAVYNHNATVAFDHQHRMYSFDVGARHGRHEEGVVHIPATWRHISVEEEKVVAN